MQASNADRNQKRFKTLVCYFDPLKEQGDAYPIVDRVLVQHDGSRERLARDSAADPRKGDRSSRSSRRYLETSFLTKLHDKHDRAAGAVSG